MQCKESLISMVIETFDRLRPGLNSFHGELLLVDHHTKVVNTSEDRSTHFLWLYALEKIFLIEKTDR